MERKRLFIIFATLIVVTGFALNAVAADIPFEKILTVRQASKVGAGKMYCGDWKPGESYLRLVCTKEPDNELKSDNATFVRITAESMRAHLEDCLSAKERRGKSEEQQLALLFKKTFEWLKENAGNVQFRIEGNPTSKNLAMERGMRLPKIYTEAVYMEDGDVVVPFGRFSVIRTELWSEPKQDGKPEPAPQAQPGQS